MGEQTRQYLKMRGYAGLPCGIVCGDYEEVRLTSDGEFAKQDFEGETEVQTSYSSDGTIKRKMAKGVDYHLFTMVAGGADGKGGVRPHGIVKFDSDDWIPAATKSPTESANKSTEQQSSRRFDVALSFPGERRQVIERVDLALGRLLSPTRVFYDKRYQAELARPGLDDYIQKIYHDESDLIVVFLCEDYVEKEWCGLELRAVRDLLKKRRMTDIMFFRFDEADVPGVFSIDGYIDANKVSPEEIAQLIVDRLRHNVQ